MGLHKEANAMNRVISSYAPSLSSLLRLHDRERKALAIQGPSKALIVAMSKKPDRQPLELSMEEASAISRAFPSSKLLTNRTTAEVLEAIAMQPQIVHFSCHGEVDYDEPLSSKLLTEDWQTSPLTVAQLQTLNIENSWLAFLSACFTANAGVENMQDEGNHLAAALLIAGFRNIVESSW
jgi:CHAT domain-containing protein